MSPLEFAQGLSLNLDELEIVELGYKLACAELNISNEGDDPLNTTIAKTIIALAQAGEMDPSRLGTAYDPVSRFD